MSDKKDPIRPTTPEAVRLAKTLMRTARYGAIAVLDARTGRPLASRVAVATDTDGTPLILISGLAAHTPALTANPACSLLLGEPGKGDPLAHPRITLHCDAVRIEKVGGEYPRIRRRYLAHNPKGALYADLGDFAFFRLNVTGASLNGGFGKAFILTMDDLVCPAQTAMRIAAQEEEMLRDINETRQAEIVQAMGPAAGTAKNRWKITGVDPDGLDLADGDHTARLFFPSPCQSAPEVLAALPDVTAGAA
ncbi:MAG: HugZ family protein [Rhizobiales bacterium]|nr:HugZ family protein [Hyphomicrobiales bacterium]OJX98549.1 MAG: pyridoxamine 5'-phosphate oxidase [Rhizobiales bacterium 63-22]